MNWLAHLFLSEHNVENRLGNLLADVVKGSARRELNAGIQRGIECHQAIDAFTDSHIVVLGSKRRISLNYKRFAGILVDIFYDHFLAKHWSKYSDVSLEEFTTQIYQSFQAYQGQKSPLVQEVITRMAVEDWLGSYSSLNGVENALIRISHRLSKRFSRSFTLYEAVNDLTTDYNNFEKDFLEFFPELLSYVKNWHLARI